MAGRKAQLRHPQPQISRSCAHAGRRVGAYDPTTGTFLTRDPMDGVPGHTTESNSYAYGYNDPLNKKDPSGKRPTDDKDFTPPPPPPACSGEDQALPSVDRLSTYGLGYGMSAEQEHCAELAIAQSEGGPNAPDTRTFLGLSGTAANDATMLSSFATCQPIASAVGEDDACWVLWHSANLTVDVVKDVIRRQTDPWKRGPAGVNAVRHFAWLSFVTAELTSQHLFDVQGTTEAKVLTEIHETFALGCNGTPNECDWDSTADSNNNNQGIEFGQQQSMQDENESERRSWIEAKAIDMLNNPGTLDLRGGCPSRHWSIPQGC